MENKVTRAVAIVQPPNSVVNTHHVLYRFRNKPVHNLDDQQASELLTKYHFYCTDQYHFPWANPSGESILHDFQLQHNGAVVSDLNTGLMWQRGGSGIDMDYNRAKRYLRRLNHGNFFGFGRLLNFTDWRLPTLEEALSLMCSDLSESGYIDPIFDKSQDYIFTADEDISNGRVWIVSYRGGFCYPKSPRYFVKVRAVRNI